MAKKTTAVAEPKIVLDKRGKPSYVLVPWERFKKLSPQQAEGLDILTDEALSNELKSRVHSHVAKTDPFVDTIPLEKLLQEV
ncbi:MAG: hypothetical protein A2Z11_02400 [Candidatus Woykebacteria bacterium RBG_16_43_9]|uniref:Prevent-host-death protein n=1 Tax=Candidatus Woykebacteria bacterium RBG_16_43_9 TaxID=1802596 RepID=A0A1G1WHT3_9BACT|nr:MAG: hypothetical protein A2Z11_02400 [Candidatus Woykebacteria bacterium RBG_16_43_9]